MTDLPSETAEIHLRLLKCTLEVENSRAYWQRGAHYEGGSTARHAFEQYWFGARSLSRTAELLVNFRARYDAYPAALRVLQSWPEMDPGTRRLICHWHLQLTDPLYRAFTGRVLVQRHDAVPAVVTRDFTLKWVSSECPTTWSTSTRIQLASKLLSAALSAGLLHSNRDPRTVLFPRVGDDALSYLLYLLKGIRYEGTLLENPYLGSVGLSDGALDHRLRSLRELSFRRQGDLIEIDWVHESLEGWAAERWHAAELVNSGSSR